MVFDDNHVEKTTTGITQWELQGGSVSRSKSFTVTEAMTDVETLCLQQGEYKFTIRNFWGDYEISEGVHQSIGKESGISGMAPNGEVSNAFFTTFELPVDSSRAPSMAPSNQLSGYTQDFSFHGYGFV